jgi:glucans biosynthesis protein
MAVIEGEQTADHVLIGLVVQRLPEANRTDLISVLKGVVGAGVSADFLKRMQRDPLRQVDIARRLSNLAKAVRCRAKTRAGHPCRQTAIRGRGRCRMHGGAKGSGGPRGDRNGNFKHGLWTRANVAERRTMRAKVREIKALLQATSRARW